MYSKILDLYFSPSGEQLTQAGESAGYLEPLEIMAGDAFTVCVHIFSPAVRDGSLEMIPVNIPAGTQPELRAFISGSGKTVFCASGVISGNTAFFNVNTSTEEYIQAAQDGSNEFILAVMDISTGSVSPSQLGRVPFRGIPGFSTTETGTTETLPDYLSTASITALWQSNVIFSFSSDMNNWHEGQDIHDKYFKISRPGGGSGPALHIPSCQRINIGGSGSAAERPAPDAGINLWLDDSSGMLSCSDGVSWSDYFPLRGPAGTPGESLAPAPFFFPSAEDENGRIIVILDNDSTAATMLQPVELPLELHLFWKPGNGFLVLQVESDGEIISRQTMDGTAGMGVFSLHGNGCSQLAIRRLTENSDDSMEEALIITGAEIKRR